ncbi:MAG: DUF924 family protein [Pseudomonadota bacterium]
MTPQAVLAFWFAEGMEARWFVKDETFDAEVRAVLGAAHGQAVAGVYSKWQDSAEGCLSLVLLLDQVSRNLYRDDPRAFANDPHARAVACRAIDCGFDLAFNQQQRCFLYLPFEHSEDLADQERCVDLMGALDADPSWRDYAVQHRDIIARFGRFPHRNRCLGRDSSPEEIAFLETPNSSF